MLLFKHSMYLNGYEKRFTCFSVNLHVRICPHSYSLCFCKDISYQMMTHKSNYNILQLQQKNKNRVYPDKRFG